MLSGCEALANPPEPSVCNPGGGSGLLALPGAVSASETLGFVTRLNSINTVAVVGRSWVRRVLELFNMYNDP